MKWSILRNRSAVLFLVAALLVLAALTAAIAKEDEGNIVAVVNGQEITEAEFYTMLERTAGANVLQQLVAEVLIRQAAEEAGFKASEEALEKELAGIKAQFPDEATFQDALSRYNLTVDELKADLELGLIMDYLAVKDVKVTDEQVRKYFDDNKSKYDTPERVKASHILVKTEAEAKDLLAKLKDGADFAELAKEFSQDPGSGPRGGDLGYFSVGEMVEEFEKAAFALEVGEVSEPVQTDYGFHLIKVTDKQEAVPADFETVKDQIRETLIQEQAKDPQTLLSEMMPKANIDVKWKRYAHVFPKPAAEPPAEQSQSPGEQESGEAQEESK